MSHFITIARIVKTRGIRGEVAAEILTDFPERFESLPRVYLSGVDRWERVENSWFHKNRVILKFAGRDRPHEAEDLVGSDVQLPADERLDLPEDTFFDSDLIGCQVSQRQEQLGTVKELFKVGEEVTNLVVETAEDREFMIPLVSEYIENIDLSKRVISVSLPSGLLDLATEQSFRTKKR